MSNAKLAELSWQGTPTEIRGSWLDHPNVPDRIVMLKVLHISVRESRPGHQAGGDRRSLGSMAILAGRPASRRWVSGRAGARNWRKNGGTAERPPAKVHSRLLVNPHPTPII